MLIAIYVYTLVDYLFQLTGAINQAHLYQQKFPFSTLLLIITRVIGRVVGILLFSWVFSFITTDTAGMAILYTSLIIVLSGVTSILGELIVRWVVSQYVKHHASKVIEEHKDDYGDGYTGNMK